MNVVHKIYLAMREHVDTGAKETNFGDSGHCGACGAETGPVLDTRILWPQPEMTNAFRVYLCHSCHTVFMSEYNRYMQKRS